MAIKTLLRDLKVLQEGHFSLNSGLHSQYYFEKFRILENPNAASKLCELIADKFKSEKIDWVIGPTTGGIVIAFEVARQMNKLAGFAEVREGKRLVGRGFNIAGKNVLIVDDVMTTGKSLVETIQAVQEKKANIVGIAVLIDRSKGDFEYDYFAVYKQEVENYEPDDCPLCRKKIPLTKPGGV